MGLILSIFGHSNKSWHQNEKEKKVNLFEAWDGGHQTVPSENAGDPPGGGIVTTDTVSPVPVKEEVIDDFNWKVKDREIGILWRYTLWRYTDATGNLQWVEKSHGTLNLYFFSIPLIGEERILPISHGSSLMK